MQGAAPRFLLQSPCVWTRTWSDHRGLEQGDRCVSRSGHLPAHFFVYMQPHWAQEDIKRPRSNIALWGIGSVAEGSALPPPPPAGRPQSLNLRLGGAVCGAGPPAGRSAGTGGSRPHNSGAPPGAAHSGGPVGPAPLNDGGAALRPLPGRVVGQIREWGITRISPRRHAAEWKQRFRESALRCMALVGCMVHEAKLAAAHALAHHEAVQRVNALVLVQGSSKAAPVLAGLLQTFCRSRANLPVLGGALQSVVRTERQLCETALPAVVDAAPPG